LISKVALFKAGIKFFEILLAIPSNAFSELSVTFYIITPKALLVYMTSKKL